MIEQSKNLIDENTVAYINQLYLDNIQKDKEIKELTEIIRSLRQEISKLVKQSLDFDDGK